MKLKKAIIVIEKSEVTKKRWRHALEGKLNSRSQDQVIICSNVKVAERLFSAPRLTILQTIIHDKPNSIKELSKIVGKNFKNVYQDVMFLVDLGLIELVKDTLPKSLKPLPIYGDLELKLAA